MNAEQKLNLLMNRKIAFDIFVNGGPVGPVWAVSAKAAIAAYKRQIDLKNRPNFRRWAVNITAVPSKP